MKHVILGTAGHIDHGKTSLVKALTGVDTDRLKEEKERGITIELGFTFLDLPSGIRLGIIDVPGHEKFVKHMVAGAWGIDLVALVIAADEGVMPQTREHLDICRLLRVKKGLVVLTKIDLLDRELLELVKEEVTDIVEDTFLKNAPILPVSSVTGEGIPQLLSALDLLSQEINERSSGGLFRLPIDRIFTMKGFGTVVTGTMISGSLSLGETIQVLPSGLEGKVRNLQVYGRSVEKTVAGERAAVNLQGVETSAIERGDVLIRPNTLSPTRLIDAYLEYLPDASRPLKHRTKQRFHVGTTLANASIFLLDRDELVPGETGFVQLRLERPVVVLPQDRFVIRGSSAIQTIGGGVILDGHPDKHKRFSSSVVADLSLLKDGTREQALRQHIDHSGVGGSTLEELLNRVEMSSSDVQSIIRQMAGKGDLLVIDSEKLKVIASGSYQMLKGRALAQLREFHQRFPMKSGLSKEELRTKLPPEVDVKLFQILISELIQSKEVVLEKDKLRLSGHQISSVDAKGLAKRVEEAVLKGGLQPPSPKELWEEWSEKEGEVRAIFEHLVHEGILVKIKSEIYFHRVPFENLREELVAYLKNHREITTPQFKEMTKASRKYVIPLIEYFDQIKLTLRLGEKRVLRSSSQNAEKK
ncbi:MAG: selenocysteine-specific translation elongation factor SelB [Deltaproteobacteria bacterium]|jgi:selenocysteine-specific elongation factor|nr:selenocysteine-specific translation elongation factor SelB [Deltaproteobacteria bacterium]